jgi:hypothetical protein
MVAMAQTLVAQRPSLARPAAKHQLRARRALLVRSQATAAPALVKGEIKDKTAETAINGAPRHVVHGAVSVLFGLDTTIGVV